MNKPNKREQQKEDTRSRIKTCARQQIIEMGFEKTTIRAIAARLGIAVGTIHSHFENKQDLLFSVFYDDIDLIFSRAMDIAEQEKGLHSRLLRLGEEVYTRFAAHGQTYSELLKQTIFANGKWSSIFEAQVHTVAMQISRWFATDPNVEANTIEARVLNFVSSYYFILIQLIKRDFRETDTALHQLRVMLSVQTTNKGC